MNPIICVVVFIAISTSAVAPKTDEYKKLIDEATAACKTSEKPTQADIDMHNKMQVPTSQAGKCYVGCMMEKMGFIENGAFSRTLADEKAKKTFVDNPELLKKVLQGNIDCEKEVGKSTNKCETGPKLMTCFEKLHKTM